MNPAKHTLKCSCDSFHPDRMSKPSSPLNHNLPPCWAISIGHRDKWVLWRNKAQLCLPPPHRCSVLSQAVKEPALKLQPPTMLHYILGGKGTARNIWIIPTLSEYQRNHSCTTDTALKNLFLSIGLPPVLPKSSGSLGIINPWAVFLLAPPLITSGTITWENLAAVLPFGGTFDLIELKGSTLKKAFEHSVYRYGQSSGEFLQVGGKLLIWEFGDYCRLGPYTCTMSQPVSSISPPNISRAIHRELGQGLNTRALNEQNLPELQLKLFL